jgi:hypothetical protein
MKRFQNLLSISTCTATRRVRGRAVQVDSIKTRAESAPGVCNHRLKLIRDELLLNVCFQFQLAPLQRVR